MNLEDLLLWALAGAFGWGLLIFRWNDGRAFLVEEAGMALFACFICAWLGPLATAYAVYLLIGDWMRARKGRG